MNYEARHEAFIVYCFSYIGFSHFYSVFNRTEKFNKPVSFHASTQLNIQNESSIHEYSTFICQNLAFHLKNFVFEQKRTIRIVYASTIMFQSMKRRVFQKMFLLRLFTFNIRFINKTPLKMLLALTFEIIFIVLHSLVYSQLCKNLVTRPLSSIIQITMLFNKL